MSNQIVTIKAWLRPLGNDEYRLITNPDLVQEGDVPYDFQAALPDEI